MKILHVIPAYKPAHVYGGPIVAIADLCEALVRTGHEVMVYTSNANGKEELDVICGKEYEVEGVKIIYHPRWTKDHSNFSPDLLRRFWKTVNHFDVIHISSWWNLITIPVAAICYLKGIHPVLSTHGGLSNFTFNHRRREAKRLFHAVIGRRLLKYCLIHVASVKEKEEAVELVGSEHSFIIYNLITMPDTRPTVQLEDDIFDILFLGRIDPVKNLEFVIEVLDGTMNIPWHLKIFGDGEEKYVDLLRLKTKGNTKITWMGYIQGAEKWKQLSYADLLVLPSRTENFGNVVIEALSQGTPVLVSDQVGLKDFIRESNLGWSVKLDPEIWRDTLLTIWMDFATRHRIREEGPRIIKEKFSTPILIDQYLKLYQHALHG